MLGRDCGGGLFDLKSAFDEMECSSYVAMKRAVVGTYGARGTRFCLRG